MKGGIWMPRSKIKKPQIEKPLYFGVYGNARAKFLKERQPALFAALKSSGTLDEYLEGYQKAYVIRAENLTKQYEKKFHITPWLRQVNYFEYAKRCFQVQVAVRDEIMKQLWS